MHASACRKKYIIILKILNVKNRIAVPDRIWSINELTKEELRDLHFELNYEPEEERWWEQEPLKVLDLSSNSLTTISDKIQFLTELKTLDVNFAISNVHIAFLILLSHFFTNIIVIFSSCTTICLKNYRLRLAL